MIEYQNTFCKRSFYGNNKLCNKYDLIKYLKLIESTYGDIDSHIK